jgi:hypothetical protein
MQIDSDLEFCTIRDLNTGTFFLAQGADDTILGMTAFWDENYAAVLFSSAPGSDNPFPCIVPERFFGGSILASMSRAFLKPDWSLESLKPAFLSPSGPGTLSMTGAATTMRVASGKKTLSMST